jgi:hypothetical protein
MRFEGGDGTCWEQSCDVDSKPLAKWRAQHAWMGQTGQTGTSVPFVPDIVRPPRHVAKVP